MPYTAPHLYALGESACRSSHVSGPSNGTLRPNSSLLCRLGVKLTVNGPSSYLRFGSTTVESRPCRRIRCASDSEPYVGAWYFLAIAGASTA